MLVLWIAEVFNNELIEAVPAVVKVEGAFQASKSFALIPDSCNASMASESCNSEKIK